MGIKRLNRFLSDYKDTINTYQGMDEFMDYILPLSKNIYNSNNKNKKLVIGIDTSLFLYKYMYSYPNFLLGFITQITRLLSNNIIPIYVFEGSPPEEKKEVLKMRNDKRERLKNRIKNIEDEIKKLEDNNKINVLKKELIKLNKQIIYISKNDIENLKKLLNIFNITYINAVGESDSMFSYLYKKNIIDVCLSDDMDILVSGCCHMIKFDKGKVIHYDLNKILKRIKLPYERFVEMCVIFGCDYVKPIPKLDNNVIYELILSNMKYHNIIKFINKNHIKPKIKALLLENNNSTEGDFLGYYRDIEPYMKAKNIYMNSHLNENIDNINFIFEPINIETLNLFIRNIIFFKNPINKNFVKRVNRYVHNINKNIKK